MAWSVPPPNPELKELLQDDLGVTQQVLQSCVTFHEDQIRAYTEDVQPP